MQQRLIVLAVIAVATSARVAAACSDNEVDTEHWMMPGILLGAAATPQGGSDFILGGELSMVRTKDTESCWHGAPATGFDFPSPSWIGGYVDGDYDFSTHAVRVTLGPEIGKSVVGIDGGLAVEGEGGNLHVGFALRPVFTLGVVQLFVRAEDFTGVGGQVESGVLLKLPVPRKHGF